ncbi:uncharacterized protein B0H18DRAFT_1116600 [Fomitopsis serialis]|uniref:uncharacterized protein n=1 Tax=Fomitopsis serialis TaxID=139415 RepID=UPI0020082A3B|nr:uncharacterized protein B0H18DRAFT_1116600 [Neoantrodia serialis]KAH9930893.1 hypothetical protein B0H18DRAFT_1116600 [Neoantrodia serialis]
MTIHRLKLTTRHLLEQPYGQQHLPLDALGTRHDDQRRPQKLTPAWQYTIPPYDLSGRPWHHYPSPSDLRAVNLDNISRDALTYTAEQRMNKARELRCSLLDKLFHDLYAQDKCTWESCAAVFAGRQKGKGDMAEYHEWISEAIERVLGDKEMSSLINGEPTHPDFATYHLIEEFVEHLDGTVWLEMASEDTDQTPEKTIIEQEFRDRLVKPVLDEIKTLQELLFDACRNAEDVTLEPFEGYQARVEHVKQSWTDAEVPVETAM